MIFSFVSRHPVICGVLLLSLTSCSPSAPPAAINPNTSNPPNSSATTAPTPANPITEPGQSTTATADPSPTDRAPSAATSPIAASPNSAPATDTIRTLSCQTSSGLVNDPNAPLNVRSEPDTGSDNVVGALADGALVSIVGERGNWWQIDAPEAGWVSKNLIDSTCNEKVARIELPPNTTQVTLSDRFLGTGYHHYQFNARAGQSVTLETLDASSPLPFLLAPDDRDITEGVANTNATRWSGKLPATGDYTLVFDSNFRGYTYNVQLDIQ
ncbi:MAG: hypothetical protein EAZ61_11295 [Oscillatoriales cyanobacterium]|nr:MAG: hypothetical protein EAZ61_11295 [Oscillatoriales cyanobacterium]